MSASIKDLAVGDAARIVGYSDGCRAYRKRLLSMGLTPGTEVRVAGVAPFGDPVQLHVRGFALSVRKDEAAVVVVEREP